MFMLCVGFSEYAGTRHVSERTDCYSLGIVLLELVTGEPAADVINQHAELEEKMFSGLDRCVCCGGCAKRPRRVAYGSGVGARVWCRCVDSRAGAWPAAAVRDMARVARMCLRINAQTRPPVRQIVPLLEALLPAASATAGGGASGSSSGGGGGGGGGGLFSCCVPGAAAAAAASAAQERAGAAFTAQGQAQAELAALARSPGFDPEFDAHTGGPKNADARRMCVCQWRAGETESVRDLPFADMLKATDGFCDLCVIGSGGSCLVYQGMLFGHLVGVKVLGVSAAAEATTVLADHAAGSVYAEATGTAPSHATSGSTGSECAVRDHAWDVKQFEQEMTTLCSGTHTNPAVQPTHN
jgi:hypothetical protein